MYPFSRILIVAMVFLAVPALAWIALIFLVPGDPGPWSGLAAAVLAAVVAGAAAWSVHGSMRHPRRPPYRCATVRLQRMIEDEDGFGPDNSR